MPASRGLDDDRSWPVLDPMRQVRYDRDQAAMRIDRSMRAWRKTSGKDTGGGAVGSIPQDGGAPLDGGLRRRMEGQLGADLSNAKIHTSAQSAQAAEGMGAKAFTVGPDVHFGSGQFAPGTKEGDRLLAHELTHVVQGRESGIQRKSEASDENADGEHGHEVSQPGEPAEVEADAVADKAADALHGEGEVKGQSERRPGKEQAPQIGAKLHGRKIHRAGNKPVRGGKRDELGAGPETGMVHVGNAVQAGVTRPPQHHVLPQEQRDWFKQRKVNVDDYCVNIDQAQHEAIHKMDWNGQVMTALRDAEAAKAKKQKKKLEDVKLSPKEIEATVRPIMALFKIDKLPFVKYGSERPEAH